jgi:MFS family permease
MLGDKYGRQKILAITIVIMSISTFCIGLIPSYATIGIWAPILLLICKMAQGFSVGGEYTGASIFVAEYSPDRKRGFMGSWLDFGSIAGFVLGAGVVVLISTVVGKRTSSTGAGVSHSSWHCRWGSLVSTCVMRLKRRLRSSSTLISWSRVTAKGCRTVRRYRSKRLPLSTGEACWSVSVW